MTPKQKIAAGITSGGAVLGLAVAMMANNGTLALWNDTAETASTQVKAGNLMVDPVGNAMTWTEAGNTTPIDTETFLISPGDALVGSQGIDVTLDGDNLDAVMNVEAISTSGDLLKAGGVTLKYTVKDANGVVVPGVENVEIKEGAVNPSFPVDKDALTAPDGAADYTVDITADFPAADATNDSKTTSFNLDHIQINLQQKDA